jgi:hypothetical protein
MFGLAGGSKKNQTGLPDTNSSVNLKNVCKSSDMELKSIWCTSRSIKMRTATPGSDIRQKMILLEMHHTLIALNNLHFCTSAST